MSIEYVEIAALAAKSSETRAKTLAAKGKVKIFKQNLSGRRWIITFAADNQSFAKLLNWLCLPTGSSEYQGKWIQKNKKCAVAGRFLAEAFCFWFRRKLTIEAALLLMSTGHSI